METLPLVEPYKHLKNATSYILLQRIIHNLFSNDFQLLHFVSNANI